MIEALEKIERELISAAQRRGAKRRRARSKRLAAGAAIGALALAAGASAITGVTPLDTPSPLTPKAAGEQASLGVQAPTGGVWTMRALRGEEGSLCVEAPPRPSPDTGGICVGYDAIASAFERTGAVVYVGAPDSVDNVHFIMGLVPADAKSIRVTDQNGRVSTPSLTGVWATTKPGDGVLAPELGGSAAPPVKKGEPLGTRAFMLATNGPYPTEGGGIKVEVTRGDGGVAAGSWPADYTP
ncbi:MAG: hypothetical protein ACR2GL_03875 [Thermoleophilaceae bacterium]